MALEQQIQRMRDSNFQEFASEQEKRTKAIMDSLSKYEQSISKDNAAYMDAIKDVVEKTGDKNNRQLSDSLTQLKQLGDLINTQQDISTSDRAELQKVISMAENQINSAKSRDGIIGKIGETISNNAIDITSVVGGLSANSPAVMFATKYVLDKRKQAKEEKQERKKAAAEEQLTRLEALAAAKKNKEVAEEQAKAMPSVGGGDVEVSSAMGGGELIVWNEIQAEELEKIRLILERTYQTNEDWRNDQETASRNDEEARRDAARYDAAVLAALQEQSSISSAQMAELQKSMSGLSGEDGGLWDTIKESLLGIVGTGAAGFAGVKAGAASAARGATGVLGRAGQTAARFAPAAGVVVGGAMIGKDMYDIGSAAFDDDILTDAQGADMGGVIGGALLGTIGAFVAGPLGAGIGMSLGNMVGEFVGDTVAPNYEAVMNESSAKIQASKEALRASINTLDQMYRDGMLTEADYTAQRAALDSQQELIEEQEEDARQVQALNQLRLQKGQAYNDLQAAITQMEENGVEVSQAMYDNLETLEEEYYTANRAFEDASAELQAKVDPTWWQSLTSTLGATWETVSAAAVGAFDSLSTGFLSAKDWLSTKYDEVAAAFSQSVEDIKGWASDKVAEAGELVNNAVDAVMESEAVQAIAETANEVADFAVETGQAAAEAVGDAVDAVMENETVQAAVETVEEGVEVVKETATAAMETVGEGIDAATQAVDDAATAVYDTVMENETVQAAVDGVGEAADVVVEKGSEALDYIGDSLSDAGDAISDTLSDWGDGISNFFGWGGDEVEAERLRNTPTSEIDRMAGNTVSMGTVAPTNPGDPDENTQLMLDALVERGITDPQAQANVLGMIEGESGMRNISEGSYRNTSVTRIREAMGRRASDFSDAELESLKQDDRAFYDAMYPELGGYDYRGRGFIQLTGRDNYERIGNAIGHDLLNNPDLMNDPEIAALASAEFIAQSGSQSGLSDMEEVYGRVYGVKPSDMRPGASRDMRMENLRTRAGYAGGFAEQLASGQLAASGVTPTPSTVASTVDVNPTTQESTVDVTPAPQDPVTGDWMAGYSAMGEAMAEEARSGSGGGVASVNAPTQTNISNNTTVGGAPMANPRRNPPPGQGVGAFGWLFR